MFTMGAATRAIAAVFSSAAMLFVAMTTATADKGSQADIDKLISLLSGGYIPTDCIVGNQYPQDPFLARLGCGENSRPGGPRGAIYSLYGGGADLYDAFGHYVHSGSPLTCPGQSAPGPIPWEGGMVVCTTARGPDDGAPTLSWTNAANLMAATATGRDLASVYAWWLTAR
jgi:hypothetical protein